MLLFEPEMKRKQKKCEAVDFSSAVINVKDKYHSPKNCRMENNNRSGGGKQKK
jgi:hypothetical protein